MKHTTHKKNKAPAKNVVRKKITRRSLLFIVFLAIAISGAWSVYHDKTTPPRFSAEQFEGNGLQYAVETIAAATVDGGAPGAVILIRKNGEDFIAASGLANKQTQQAMPTDEPLRIGSVSKVYTATVILALANQGLLKLDDRISDYLPRDVTDDLHNADAATIRQLLNHTGGIPDYYDIRSYLTQDWTQPITLERTLPVAKRRESSHVAGEKFEYSNMGYILLGEIAERVTGQNLGELITQQISSPLSLSHTYYNVKHADKSIIHGYGTLLRPWADTYDWWEHSGPDAGMLATASETAGFLEALTFDNGKLKPIGTQMLQTMVEGDGSHEKQGMGLTTITSKDGNTLIGHTGDVFGYQTVAFAWPEADAVFVAQVNCDCSTLTSSILRNAYQAIKANLVPASH